MERIVRNIGLLEGRVTLDSGFFILLSYFFELRWKLLLLLELGRWGALTAAHDVDIFSLRGATVGNLRLADRADWWILQWVHLFGQSAAVDAIVNRFPLRYHRGLAWRLQLIFFANRRKTQIAVYLLILSRQVLNSYLSRHLLLRIRFRAFWPVLVLVFWAIMSWLLAKRAKVLRDDQILGLGRVPWIEESNILLMHIYRFRLVDILEHDMMASLITVIEAFLNLISLIQSFS